MNYQTQYTAKKCSPDEAIALIRNEDAVLAAGEPGALLRALYKSGSRFSGLRLYSVTGLSAMAGAEVYAQEMAGHMEVVSAVLSQEAGNAWGQGGIDQTVVNLSEAEAYIGNYACPTVVLAHCPPMDENGYFYLGTDSGYATAVLSRGAKVIVQVNGKMPLICSDECRVHISAVTAIVEHTEALASAVAWKAEPSAEDKAIAGFVAELIPNGAVLQLGEGLIPELVGRNLLNHKDLGIHTDCVNEALIELMQKGAVNNSKKELLPGLSVGGYFRAPAESLQFLHKNPAVMMKPLSWVCDPSVISLNSGVISVNTGIAVDFRGQVCSGSLGVGFSGGAGSHLDFARGAKRSAGGKSFIVMRSTSVGKDGKPVSNIYPGLPEGSLVSIPRSDIMYIVTEYGAIDIRDLSVKERVDALISLAHPDFREWLSDEVIKHKYY